MAEMEIKRSNPEGLSQPVGYSQLVTVTGAKKLIFTGGKAGIYADDTFPESLEAQAKLTFENIDVALKAAGASREDVLNIEIFVVDLANIDPTPLYQAVRDYFPLGHKPTSMVIGVSALAYPFVGGNLGNGRRWRIVGGSTEQMSKALGLAASPMPLL